MFVEIENGKVVKTNSIIPKEKCKINNINTFWVDSDIPDYPDDGKHYYLSLDDNQEFVWIQEEIVETVEILSNEQMAIYETQINVEYLVALEEMNLYS